MAFQLKQLLQVNQDGDRLWSTDKTGAYVGSYNETGWGTPNPVLANSASLFMAIRKGADADVLLDVVGGRLFYNPTVPNTQENTCEFIFTKDGWHRVTMLVFPVSLNDTTFASDDSAIPNAVYYYYSGSIYLRTSGAGVLILEEDYIDLIENDTIVQDYAEGVFFPQLSIILSKIYKQYIKSRDGNCDDKDYLLSRYDELRADLESVYNLFWTGLTIQSSDLVDSLLDKYSDTLN